MIELIGVLAILAIVVSVTTESILSRVAATRRQAEVSEMARIVACMEKVVKRDHQLPAPSDWPSLVAAGLACPPSLIHTNSYGAPRLWIPDPGWNIAGRGPLMAYRQDAYGTAKPQRIRVLLVSAPSGVVPEPSESEFERWWESLAGAISPGGTWAETFRDDDVVVERIGFEPLFHRVVLNNLSTDIPARWAVDRVEDAGSCSPGRHHEAYYIESSRLLLLDSRGAIQEVVLIQDASSWVFDAGRWHRHLGPSSGSGLNELARIPSELAAMPALSGLEPVEVADAMYDLMAAYIRWSADDFRRAEAPSFSMLPSHRRVAEAAERLADVSAHFLQP